MRLRLGTRGSALAVGQSEQVADLLRARGHDVELVRIKTGGDVERGSLTRVGGIGVFAAELRTALLDGECDFAVHSLKDLPTAPVPGLMIAAVPDRADARDALVGLDGAALADLPAGATVGTGSPRRVAQLRALRPDLTFVDVRGNVGTRLARVAEGDLDAVVLAAAGLARLGLSERITDHLTILPAPGQGALALECRQCDPDIAAELRALDHGPTRAAVEAERGVLAGLGGGCAAPIAAWAAGGTLEAGVFAADGATEVRWRGALEPGAAETAVAELLRAGAADVAELTASRPSRLSELHDDESLWGGEQTLAGVHIFLPREDGPLAEGLRAAGAEVTAESVVRRVPLSAEISFDGAGWLALTSPATVAVLGEAGITIPTSARVAAVGGATAAAARSAGIAVDLVPEGESSARSLVDAWPEGSGRVVIPGSALSAPTLAEGLRAKGYDVDPVALYTVEPVATVSERLARDYGTFEVVVVTAGSVARAVDSLLGWPEGAAVVAFGPPSAEALAELGVPVAAVAETQDVAGVATAISSLGKASR